MNCGFLYGLDIDGSQGFARRLRTISTQFIRRVRTSLPEQPASWPVVQGVLHSVNEFMLFRRSV
jgi:hypothetical protein